MTHLRLGTRITLWSGVVVALGILLCGLATTLFIHHERIEELDRQLAAEAGHFLEEWKLHGGPSFDWVKEPEDPREWSPASFPPHYVEAVNAQDAVLYRSPNLPAQGWSGHTPGFRDEIVNGARMRLGTFTEEGLTLRVLGDYQPVIELTGHLVLAFVVAVPVILVFVFLGGRWIAHQAVAPIQQIIESAERITTQRLDQRLPIPPAHDEIHRLATVLNHTLDRLDEGFRQATRFTADASHELKTPLTVLRTSVEALLRSPDLSAGDQQAVAGLIEQTKRLSSITTSLLLLSRADVGKLSLDLTPGDLSEIVGLCVEDARIVAEENRISIHVETPSKAQALLDPTRAAQIVMNLLDNAVKFNRDSGEVRVELTASAGHWRLRVRNTGPGIRPEVAPQLFTRFFRGEHTAATGGHGLGLSLSRELARAHGGELAFDGAEGGWTAFVLTIPTISSQSF